jgi:hypothetical protein
MLLTIAGIGAAVQTFAGLLLVIWQIAAVM